MDMRMDRKRDRSKPNVESLITGMVVGGGALAYWFLATGAKPWWILAVALFGGILPAARGLSGMIASRAAAPATKRLGEKERALENERSVLRMAREKGGRLTPALVALDCDMGIEKAEAVLDGLAKKGHASMRVRDDGRIEYEFSEFLPTNSER